LTSWASPPPRLSVFFIAARDPSRFSSFPRRRPQGRSFTPAFPFLPPAISTTAPPFFGVRLDCVRFLPAFQQFAPSSIPPRLFPPGVRLRNKSFFFLTPSYPFDQQCFENPQAERNPLPPLIVPFFLLVEPCIPRMRRPLARIPPAGRSDTEIHRKHFSWSIMRDRPILKELSR